VTRAAVLPIFVAAIAASQRGTPAPTFRSGTKLVEVSVVVHDSKGAPVADLRREEFQILDNGGAPGDPSICRGDAIEWHSASESGAQHVHQPHLRLFREFGDHVRQSLDRVRTPKDSTARFSESKRSPERCEKFRKGRGSRFMPWAGSFR
jgi:hypothetical protein